MKVRSLSLICDYLIKSTQPQAPSFRLGLGW